MYATHRSAILWLTTAYLLATIAGVVIGVDLDAGTAAEVDTDAARSNAVIVKRLDYETWRSGAADASVPLIGDCARWSADADFAYRGVCF